MRAIRRLRQFGASDPRRMPETGGTLRRQDIKLRRAARDGDRAATLALAERYLTGVGLPRHVQMGLQYLALLRDTADAALLVCRCLSLNELIDHGQEGHLAVLSTADPRIRATKAVWEMLNGRMAHGLVLLQDCLPRGNCTIHEWRALVERELLAAVLEHFNAQGLFDGRAVALAAAKRAFAGADVERFALMLRMAIDLQAPVTSTHEWIYRVVTLSLEQGRKIRHLVAHEIQPALEWAAARSDAQAWLILGMALSGLQCGENPAAGLVTRENLRRGTALLVRAADAGYSEAWLHLHKLNSNTRCSVANPEMARFCLEKAASAGHAEAQRRLGALTLSRGKSVQEMEQAVGWLHLAAKQRDPYAWELMRSLVLPVEGDREEFDAAIRDIEQTEPWLCALLRLSREFGLTKQEALSLDPVAAERPWGLVTTPMSFLGLGRAISPRVVPAVDTAAAAALKRTVALFSRTPAREPESPQRIGNLRRRIAYLGLDETLFFAGAGSAERDRVRVGTRWAHYERDLLRGALSSADSMQARSLSPNAAEARCQ
jgi:TPR repeat protein